MNRTPETAARHTAAICRRDILIACIGLCGLGGLSLAGPGIDDFDDEAEAIALLGLEATDAAAPRTQAITKRIVSDASVLGKRHAAPAGANAGVGFSLWAQSQLGPLNLVVVSRSADTTVAIAKK
jgi:hypothetical protein